MGDEMQVSVTVENNTKSAKKRGRKVPALEGLERGRASWIETSRLVFLTPARRSTRWSARRERVKCVHKEKGEVAYLHHLSKNKKGGKIISNSRAQLPLKI